MIANAVLINEICRASSFGGVRNSKRIKSVLFESETLGLHGADSATRRALSDFTFVCQIACNEFLISRMPWFQFVFLASTTLSHSVGVGRSRIKALHAYSSTVRC